MADMTHFTLNSDYTSLKEAQDFELTLVVPRKDIASYDSYHKYIDIYVPTGAFVENINLYWSWTGDTVPCSTYIYNDYFTYGQLAYYITLFRQNATTYRLDFYATNTDSSSHNTPTNCTITAKAHLFVTNK